MASDARCSKYSCICDAACARLGQMHVLHMAVPKAAGRSGASSGIDET